MPGSHSWDGRQEEEEEARRRSEPHHPSVEQHPGPTNREPNSTTLVQTPPCCDAPLTNMGLSILKIKTVEKQRRSYVINSRQQTTY